MKHIGCFATRKEEMTHLRSLRGDEMYEALNEMIAVSEHIAFSRYNAPFVILRV